MTNTEAAEAAPPTEQPPTEHPSLAAALAAFQAALPKVGKDNTAKVASDKGSYTYRYADLSEISPVVLPLLAAQGLSWSTRPTLRDGRFVLLYALRHTSGEADEGEYPLPEPRSSPQVLGSAITYARRYALCAVTGVAPGDDDDDAAAAQEQQQRRQGQNQQQRRPENSNQAKAGARPNPEKPQDNGGATPSRAADAARDLLRAECTKNGWDLARVSVLFAESHGGADLRQADMRTVDTFRKGLYARPDHELREQPAASEPPAEAEPEGAAQ